MHRNYRTLRFYDFYGCLCPPSFFKYFYLTLKNIHLIKDDQWRILHFGRDADANRGRENCRILDNSQKLTRDLLKSTGRNYIKSLDLITRILSEIMRNYMSHQYMSFKMSSYSILLILSYFYFCFQFFRKKSFVSIEKKVLFRQKLPIEWNCVYLYEAWILHSRQRILKIAFS